MSHSAPDASLPQLLQQARDCQASGSAGGSMSAAKLLAVDAAYKLEPQLCRQLNAHLEDSEFGPFQSLPDAVFKLLHLQRAGKTSKAGRLERLLSGFATAHHGSMDSLMQWRQLLDLKKERDAFAHPFRMEDLQRELDSNHPDLRHVKDALSMLLASADGH